MRSAAVFDTAENDCLGEGKRLPTATELQTFRTRSEVTTFTSDEWVSGGDADGTRFWRHTVGPDGIVGAETGAGTNPYRCVTLAG